MNHPFNIGGVPMQSPVMLGGGVCKFVHQLTPYLRPDLPAGALEVGSFTPAFREGNFGATQWPENYESLRSYFLGLNAWSMPNKGFRATAAELMTVQSLSPIIANIAGFVPEDFVQGVTIFEALTNVAGTTLNLGCPNTENNPIAYDLASTTAILDTLQQAGPRKPVWVKLSPYITPRQRGEFELLLRHQTGCHVDMGDTPTAAAGFLVEVLRVLLDYPFVTAVILTNTLGNVKVTNPKNGELVIGVNNGRGGLSGDFLREHIVLPLVEQAAGFLKGRLDIVACGGVFEGSHVLDYLNTGAKGVQCVSGPTWGGGPRFFSDLIQESEALQEYLTD